MRPGGPVSIVHHAACAGGKIGARDDRRRPVETRLDKLAKGLGKGRRLGLQSEPLHVVRPVEDRPEPLGVVALADGLRVGAQVDAAQRRHLGEDLALQEAVVVWARRLDGAAAPPAALLAARAWLALERSGSPRRPRLGRHGHLRIDVARPRLVVEGVVELAVGALRARCSRRGGRIVILVAGSERRLATALPHALREQRGDVAQPERGAVGVFRVAK
mmetsp:Transcript_27226/g.81216  ORF Transcript_27226/g.81216 Transcript_27226/m.81216 type:complete len:218 (-) Transcript_27226:1968-2621(-)